MNPIECDMATETRLRDLEAQVALLSRARQPLSGLTIIAFSNDMDKIVAAFMLANGAAAMGIPVAIFFTFWGLAALKRKAIFKGKGPVDRLLTAMLPAGPHRLGPSKWSMLGMGRLFFAALMRRRCITSLEELIALSRELNVRLVACETAMEVMAVTREELLEGVEFGGVVSCIDEALNGNVTLFV